MKNSRIFSLEKVEQVAADGIIRFFKLAINGKCPFDRFCTEMDKNSRHRSSFSSIISYMDAMATGNIRFPRTKFNSIKRNNKVVGYEFKKDALRIYVTKKDPNVCIILGGFKNEQKRDIERFLLLLKEIEEQQQQLYETRGDTKNRRILDL